MKIDKLYDEKQGEWIFKPSGDIDIHNSDIFKKEVLDAFNQNQKDIVIDGEKLDYIDSMGLGALIYILKELKDLDYEIPLMNIKPNIKKLLSITELDKMFLIRGEKSE